jgi:hypothetical protein
VGTDSQAGVVSAENSPPRVVSGQEGTNDAPGVVGEPLADHMQDGAETTREAKVNRSDVPGPKPREVRHAHLFVTNIDPWSVMKNAFMFAIALGIVMIVAVTILWGMLSMSGTFDSIVRTVNDVVGDGPQAVDVAEFFSFSRVVGTTAVLATLEVVLLTALITLFAFLYNLAVGITGGLQVTLTNDS